MAELPIRDDLITFFTEQGIPVNLETPPEGILSEEYLRDQPMVALVLELRRLVPDRFLSYDSERIWNDDDYATLLERYAAITGGEWQPQRVHSWLSSNHRQAYLRFEWRGVPTFWEMSQMDDWVSQNFHNAVKSFSQGWLQAEFVRIPTGGQGVDILYLPSGVARSFQYRFLTKR